MTIDDLLPLAAAAAGRNVPCQTAWSWAVNGLGRDRDKLPARRLGRTLFVAAGALDEYMRRHGRAATRVTRVA